MKVIIDFNRVFPEDLRVVTEAVSKIINNPEVLEKKLKAYGAFNSETNSHKTLYGVGFRFLNGDVFVETIVGLGNNSASTLPEQTLKIEGR